MAEVLSGKILSALAVGRYWHEDLSTCYLRGGVCKDCPIQEMIETKCYLKYVLIELVRQGKKPKELKQKGVRG